LATITPTRPSGRRRAPRQTTAAGRIRTGMVRPATRSTRRRPARTRCCCTSALAMCLAQAASATSATRLPPHHRERCWRTAL